MKWLIASDIHGSAYYCKKLLERFEAEGAQRILLLGDVLYHGPRNDLPRDYAPKEVIAMLNFLSDRILCVRGNCDAEVDQMVLDFPVLADYALIDTGKYIIYATHGHVYNEGNLPPLRKGDILLHGHTHVTKCSELESCIYMNPGSVSLPKEGTANGYMTYENSSFRWFDIDGNEIMNYSIT